MKYIIAFFKNFSLFITSGLTLLLILSSLAPYLNPTTFWLVSLTGLGFPFLFFIVLFFFIFWIVARIRYALVPLAGLIVAVPVCTHYFSLGFNHLKPKEKISSVKVMSYNVRNFDFYNWNSGLNTQSKMMSLISDVAPDIANFQEYFTTDAGEYNNTGLLKNKVGFKYSNVYLNFSLYKTQHWGMATYSNYRIINKGVVDFKMKTKNGCIFSDIDVNGKIIRVYNTHLQSVRLEKKDYAYISDVEDSVQFDPQSNRIILSKLKNAFIKRAKQVEIIKEHIASSPYPVIVCGDFNDTPNSFAYHEMTDKLSDSFLESSWGIGHTYNVFLPIFRIDYILHDKNFIAYNYRCAHEDYTDHYPIVTELSIQ